MTLSMRSRACFSAATNLGPEDTSRFLELHDQYAKAGASETDAAKSAANDLLSEIRSEAADLSKILGPVAEKPAMSRRASVAGQRQSLTEGVVDAIRAQWGNAPEIVVLSDMQDARVPASVAEANQKQIEGGATGVPAGFVYGGKVYVVASEMDTTKRVMQTLFHEGLGHLGLRGAFGTALDGVLDDLAAKNDALVRAKARQYGLSMEKPAERRRAAEEVLAEMAETRPTLTWVQQAIARIRTWLRGMFKDMAFSNDEIVRDFIVPARDFIEQEGRSFADTAPGVQQTSFARRTMTEQAAREQGFTLKAYRGVSKASPFNDTGTTWLTTSRDVAEAYAEEVMGYTDPVVLTVMVNPDSLPRRDASRLTDDQRAELGADGFGNPQAPGIYDRSDDHPLGGSAGRVTVIHAPNESTVVVDETPAFSRIGDIAAGIRGMDQTKARNLFLDAVTSHSKNGAFNALNTQYAKAKRNPTTFGPVFDAVQNFIKDTSVFANAAADLAPNILPKLESWRDLKKSAAPTADMQAAGSALWNGTLTDQKVYDDGELRAMGLTAPQIGLYREFRAAIDQSLDDLVRTELVRLGGDETAAVRQEAMAAPSASAAADVLKQFIEQTNPDSTTLALLDEKLAQMDRLKSQGYAPLMRFGRHTLHITDPEGATQYFGMYESRIEANQAARAMRDDPQFADSTLKQGLMSSESYKLFQGMNLDSLELFADTTGNSDNPVYQDFLKLTKSNRSAMKRMIHRQGIAGFDQSGQRVLAAFITSNARAASGNLHMGEAKTAAEAIPKELGDVRDDAINLIEYVQAPKEEAALMRGMLFANFIGGSIASAAVNLTQPFTMTLPYLSQYGGVVNAGRHLLAAARAAAGGALDPHIAKAMARAEDNGIVSPQEIHHLQAEVSQSNPMLRKAAFVWGSLFSLSEQFNRRMTFIAAYNAALEQHMEDPQAFAEQAVIETQGLYNKGNKPNAARGAIGATVMTFKQFSIHYLEFLSRMARSGPEGKKAVGVALAVLMLTAGAGGLPFADDLDDLIDTLAQALGYDFSSKRTKRKFIAETLGMGEGIADFATGGISKVSGVPIDVSLRMGMGNLLPGTGILLRSNTDRTRDVLEFAGAAGSLAKSGLDAAGMLLQGDVADAGIKMAPLAIQNMLKAATMWNTGEYRDTRGRKVVDVGPGDAVAKAIGFQPAEVARESATMGEVQRSVQLARNVESEIAGKWAQGLRDNDQEAVSQARQDLREWNDRNDSSMKITMQQIIRRVREMRDSRVDRAIRGAPKEMRSSVREALQ